MLKKNIILLVAGLMMSVATHAQTWDWATSLHYSFGIPTGDLQEFTDNTSARGIFFEARKFQTEQLSVGFSFGWQVFKDRLDGTFSDEGIDVTGTQVRYVNTFPIMVTGHYHFGSSDGVRPYLGLGVGTLRSLQRTDVGLFTVSNNNWHFGFYPEAGVYIPVSFDMGITVAAKYNYGLATSDSFDYTYLALSVGFTWLN